jgi:hypothetical protein
MRQSLYLSPWAKTSGHPQKRKTIPAAKATFFLNSIFCASLFQMIRHHRIATAGECLYSGCQKNVPIAGRLFCYNTYAAIFFFGTLL